MIEELRKRSKHYGPYCYYVPARCTKCSLSFSYLWRVNEAMGLEAKCPNEKNHRKHEWEPVGVGKNRYVEAVCEICGEKKFAGAAFGDRERINWFWIAIEYLEDCRGIVQNTQNKSLSSLQ